MTWDLYALRYGSQPELAADATTIASDRKPSSEPRVPFCYFFWLARSAVGTVLIDCGFTERQAQQRGKTRLASPVDLLAEIHVSPEDIDHIILTHLHYDHVGNVDVFDSARIYIHADEWNWALSSAMSDSKHSEYYDPETLSYLISRLYSDDLHLLTNRKNKVAGLDVEHLGGHSPGQMIVHVPTASDQFVLASDAAHLNINVDLKNPFPIVHDIEKAKAALSHLSTLSMSGSQIIAGHDQDVFRYGSLVGTSGNIVKLQGTNNHV